MSDYYENQDQNNNQLYNNGQNPFRDQLMNGGQSPYGEQSSYGSQSPYGGQPQVGGQNPYGGQSPYGDSYYDQMYGAQQAQMQSGLNLNSAVGQGAALGFEALNSVLGRSFLYMFIALLLTGITSVIVASSPALLTAIFASGRFSLLIIFGLEIGIVIACTAAMKSNNATLSAILFAAYSIINGLTFSVIFLAFQLSSIINVFFTTALVFGIMAFLGGVTKRDLTKLGNILLAGLIGIIIGSVINLFVGSSGADFIITILGVVIFMGFTAYDVNKIIKLSNSYTGLSTNVIALYGAMQLYLDFINLFLKLLRLFGKRK